MRTARDTIQMKYELTYDESRGEELHVDLVAGLNRGLGYHVHSPSVPCRSTRVLRTYGESAAEVAHRALGKQGSPCEVWRMVQIELDMAHNAKSLL